MKHLKVGVTAGILALAAMGVAAGAAGAATLTGITVASEGEATTIHVTLDQPVDFDHFTLADPARFVLDCIGVDQVAMEAMPAGSGLAQSLQADIWKGAGDHSVTRLLVNLSQISSASVAETPDGLVVTLVPDAAASWSEGEAEAVAEPAPAGDEPGLADAAPAGDVMEVTPAEDVPELTPAEEAFEFASPVRPEYQSDFTRGDAPSVASFLVEQKSTLAGRGGARVSLDVQGADIYTVLRSISEYSGVNVVVGYDVRQKLTEPMSFHLVNVPWGDALEMVLQSAHLWYREENGIIRVDTEENLRKEGLERGAAQKMLEDVMPLTTRIVNVVYAAAPELKGAVQKSLSARGMIEVDPRTNSLVITDIPPRVESLVEMVQHLDSQTPQVEIVAKLVEVDARFSRELGVLWDMSDISTGGASFEGVAGSNSVIDAAGEVRFGLVKSWGQVTAVISALESDNKANIISNPRITTVNNREAKILVGKKIPLIVLDEAGNPVTQLITIGITLLVTPHINDNNRITLDMHPEVSDLSSQATVQGGVIINTSEADTRVMVGNGETAVIGGLIRSNETTLKRGIPVLKEIPILGGIFRGSSTVKEKRELLIFVTPRIISSFAGKSDQ